MEIYERIKNLREDHEPKITQSQLGKILFMSQKKISRLEVGAAKPTPEDLQQLCLFYHVSADYILGLPEGLPYPKR